jgi:hypothetical protein
MMVIVMVEQVEKTSVHDPFPVSWPLNKAGDAMLEGNDRSKGAACAEGGLALGIDAFNDR